MKNLPIITNEQIKTGIWIFLFILGGVLLKILFLHKEELGKIPQSLWQQPTVTIRLTGGVLPPAEKTVSSHWSVWQAIVQDNPMKRYINWDKIPMARKVYEGMELFVPIRKLRAGEKISWNLLTQSQGRLILALPCLGAVSGKLEQKLRDNQFPPLSDILRKARNEYRKCSGNYVMGW